MKMTRKIWDELTAAGKLEERNRRLPGPVVMDGRWVIGRPSKGLGDWLAELLTRVGIRGWKGCGCQARRRRLNEIGARVAGWLR